VREKKATIEDVAKRAGVSLSTVSAVLNRLNVVKPDTRQRILAAIKQLKYHPNLYASNLARRRTRILGLIVSDIVNPFFAETARAIEREASARGYRVSLAATGFSPEQLRSWVSQMIATRVAGLAVMTSESDEEAMQVIRSQALPTVFLDVGVVSKTISNIRVDTRSGLFQSVCHLVELGHKQILFVRNSPIEAVQRDLLSHKLRHEGFSAAIRKFRSRGVEGTVIDHPGDGAMSGLQAIHQTAGKLPFTAVVAINDSVAIGVYRGLDDAGYQIPNDVSVVGFDNTHLCEFLNPPLTTVNIPRDVLGQMVVSTLIKTAETQEPGQELVLGTELVVRKSTSSATTRGARPRGRNTLRA
jgi:DNA-binding LacI/PurR family transcriptional regulator